MNLIAVPKPTAMRYIVTIMLLFAMAETSAQETPVPSRIKAATVFLNGAQITRTLSVDVPAGTSTLVLSGVSPGVNESTIQVEGADAFKITGVSFRINYLKELKKSEQSNLLEQEKKKTVTLIDEDQGADQVYQEEEAMLRSNKSIGGQQEGVNVSELKIAVDYFRQRMFEIRAKRQQLKERLVSHQASLSRIESQLLELKNRKQTPSGEILIKASTKGRFQGDLIVTYLVKEAGWLPLYDVRAKDVSSPVSIAYKANISQQSGEDWEGITLTVSSANPSDGGTRPILKPWIVGFNNNIAFRDQLLSTTPNANQVSGRVVDEYGASVPGVNVMVKGTTVGTVSDADGRYTIPLTRDAYALVFSFIGMVSEEVPLAGKQEVDLKMKADVTQLSEVVVAGYGVTGSYSGGQSNYNYYREPKVKKTIVATPVIRQTNVEYTLDEPYTIKSDGETRTVQMIEYEVEALYEYYAAPKLDNDAFLTARLINWDEMNLLEGEANLFFEGKFLGKSILDTRNTSDTLTLSLGRDKNVVVTREKVKDYTSSQFIGSNRKSVFTYEIKVRNKKKQAITIRLEDQVPVPNTREIEVDKLEDTKAQYNAETGVLAWNKKLDSGKTETIMLKYAVRYPKHQGLILE